MYKRPEVIFFGSGPVAAKSLSLLKNYVEIEAVVTKPATYSDMSRIVGETPVFAASNKQELDELIAKEPFSSVVAILIDFGIIVSRSVIDKFPMGIINSHFSVLPDLRGADPISFAILSGQRTTGVSLMLLDEGMDTGKILVTKSMPVSDADTTPRLTDRLINLSDNLLSEFVPKYLAGSVKPRSQSHPDRATYSRKLTKEDGTIDWTKPAEVIEREIRAFVEWPKSHTTLGGKKVIVTKAHATPSQPAGSHPGDLEIDEPSKKFGVITGSGTLWIDCIKPAGKKEMSAKSFLAGYRHLLR